MYIQRTQGPSSRPSLSTGEPREISERMLGLLPPADKDGRGKPSCNSVSSSEDRLLKAPRRLTRACASCELGRPCQLVKTTMGRSKPSFVCPDLAWPSCQTRGPALLHKAAPHSSAEEQDLALLQRPTCCSSAGGQDPVRYGEARLRTSAGKANAAILQDCGVMLFLRGASSCSPAGEQELFSMTRIFTCCDLRRRASAAGRVATLSLWERQSLRRLWYNAVKAVLYNQVVPTQATLWSTGRLALQSHTSGAYI